MRQAKQLAAPVAAPGAAADGTLVTGGASEITIVRHIRVFNTTTGALTFRLAIGGTTATQANCIVYDQSVPANTGVDVYGPYVLPASGTVHYAASGTGVTFEASGEISVAGG